MSPFESPRSPRAGTPLWRRYLRFWGPDPAADVDDEFAFHLEMRIEELRAQGLSPEAARDEARAGILPVQVSYAEGQAIVEEGSPITPEAREALLASGLIEDENWQWDQVGAAVILSVLAAGAVAAGLAAFRPGVTVQEMLVITLAVAIPVFIMKIYLPFILPDEDRHFLAYLLPVAAASMVLAGFVGAELALLASTIIAFLASFAAVLLLDVTVVGLAGSLDVARIAISTGVAGAAGVFAVRNAWGGWSWVEVAAMPFFDHPELGLVALRLRSWEAQRHQSDLC